MKFGLKLLALILAMIFCFSVLVACDGSGSSEETTAADSGGNQETSGEQSTEVTPDMPSVEQKNYDDVFYLFLESSGAPMDYYWVEESQNDVLSAALYNRQQLVLNHLGVEIYAWHNASSDYTEEFKTAVKTKSGAIDMMTTHVSIGVSGLVSDGYLYQFNEMPGIDLDADYWNRKFMDSLAISDMYFLGFSDFNILRTHVIAFNKSLLEKYDDALDKSLYEMVDDYEWTIDEMINLAKVAFINNGSTDKNQYGMTGLQWVPWCGFLEGCGINLVEMNDEGVYSV